MNDKDKRATVPADQIPVAAFRQIFHWPLSLRNPDDPKAQIDRIARDLGADWVRVDSRPDVYEEGVYFHDTVQAFLYPDSKSGERCTFARPGLTALSLTIDGKARAFKVSGLTLDLFAFGVAVITLELEAENPGMLSAVQTVIDHARRAFPGYWMGGDDSADPGLCPTAASLTMNGETRSLLPLPRSAQRAHWRTHGVPAMFPWWQEIAAPLVLDGQPNPHRMPVWRHVLDERIPVMSFVSVTNPTLTDQEAYDQIGEGDWFRIAAADAAGRDPMPYNTAFLQAQAGALFYDRFHHDAGTTYTTRQCFAGYHHALVGSGWFFDNIILSHFRGHYRQMNLIVQMEFAALLTFSRRISDLVRAKNRTGDERAFRAGIYRLRADLLAFTNLFAFADVSNHLQGREMNRKLREAVGLDALRADVQGELAAASDFAGAAESREATASQSRLTEFATLFLPASLAAGLAALGSEAAAPMLAQLGLWLGLAYALGAGFLRITGECGRSFRLSLAIAAAGLGLAALVWAWEARHGTPFWPATPPAGVSQNG